MKIRCREDSRDSEFVQYMVRKGRLQDHAYTQKYGEKIY